MRSIGTHVGCVAVVVALTTIGAACGGRNGAGSADVVTVTGTDAAGPVTFGPIEISNVEVNTGHRVQAGSQVQTSAHGIIDFGGAVLGVGAPRVGPDGDSRYAPADYPAPQLHKNSLIVRVGASWYQGGTDASFVPIESGELILSPNDAHLEDNSQKWTVSVTITPP